MPRTYIHNLKCLTCQLHFQVYSWYKDWPLWPHGKRAHCPECGEPTRILHSLNTSDKEIYQFVDFGIGKPRE